MNIFNKIDKLNTKSLREFIIFWDNKFPFDLWWRKKYNIPFNSSKHREISLLDMKIEWIEELLVKKHEKLQSEKKDYDEDSEIWSNSWLKPQKNISIPLTEKEFEDLDLSQFDIKE